MKWTITAVLGVILSSLASSILAYTDQLGEDGVLVPYVEIPFVTSTIVKNVGEAISDGSCRFPLSADVPPDLLQDDLAYVSVRRAIDPVNCEEILEQGVALKPLPEIAQSTSDNASSLELFVPENSGDNDEMSSLSSATYQEAEGYIRYTDGRNPYVEEARELFPGWDGFTASEVTARISGEWGDSNPCPYTPSFWRFSRHSDYSLFWEEAQQQDDVVDFTCGYLQLSVYREHYTDSKNDLLEIDCSEGATISYDPVSFRLERDGTKNLDASYVTESGPREKCLDYLVRFQVFE